MKYEPHRDIYEFVKQVEMLDDNAEWVLRNTHTFYRSPSERFEVRNYTNGSTWGYGRMEHFNEQGIDVDREDEREMARVFVEEIGMHFSPHDMMVFRAAINKYLADWNEERVANGYPVYEYEAT